MLRYTKTDIEKIRSFMNSNKTDVKLQNSEDDELKAVFKDIKLLNMDVASPFIIKVYYDYH